MESVPKRIDALTPEAWNQAWHYRPHVSRMERQLAANRRAGMEPLMEAAYFVAGKLHDDDFHLFTNGGQPLLKRQRDGWLDEVLFHTSPNSIQGHYRPVSIELMTHFEALRDIRAKISRSCAMVPATVACVNIGLLQDEPLFSLWNLERPECFAEIGSILSQAGLAWIDDLCDPVKLEDRVIAGTLPHVDDATGLELVLATGGKISARRVIDAWRADPVRGPKLATELRRLQRSFGPVYRGERTWQNVAVLCVCYDLIGKPSQRR